MSLRRALIVTYHFPPSSASGSFRLLGFARHLPRAGWAAVVVAPPRLPWEAVDPELLRQVPPETVLYSVSFHENRLSLPLRLWAPFTSWLVKAWPACVRAVRRDRPEVVLTSGPPHLVHTLGLLVKRRFGIPWVADFRDPWIACTPRQSGSTWRDRAEARLERAVMHRADRIIANAPNACDALRQEFPEAAGRMAVITNGFDPERFPPPAATGGDSFTIIYSGSIYAGRDPRLFLDAVRTWVAGRPAGVRPVRVAFFGCIEADYLAAEVRARGLEGVVTIHGQIPYAESLAAMARSDVLLLLDSPGRRIGVPAKLYEYLGAGRPVLALSEADGDTAWVLRESGLPHRIAPPDDPAAILEALAGLATEVESGRAAVGPGSGRLQFTREMMASRLAEEFANCVPRHVG
jgi:glycosyltransferase involved in cell wall biosynthesis